MVNFKKIDDKDLVFVNNPLSTKDDKEFSDFLKARKAGKTAKRKTIREIKVKQILVP
jgi:hypothetical protein